MMHTNINRKAPNAPSKVQGAFQNTNTVNCLTDGAVNQSRFTSKLIAVIKSAAAGFYLDRSVGLDSIAVIVILILLIVGRALQ